MGLTQPQTDIIKATVPILAEHGVSITTEFYKNMLTENPSLYKVFNIANQVTGHQQRALAGAVYAYAANIENLSVLGPAIETIVHKHCSLYIQPADYEIVAKYLLQAMKIVLGDACTEAVLDAWGAAYWQLADVLIAHERALYQSTDGWTDWRDFRIVRKVVESTEITSFYLEPVDGGKLPTYNPGQYISVQIEVPSLGGGQMQARQYSLSDVPGKSHYRISVKRDLWVDSSSTGKASPGHVSNALHDTKNEGDVIRVSHPFGEFFLSADEQQASTPLVLLSAGVGLTPMVSMLNTITSTTPTSKKRKVHFIHCARSLASLAFKPHVSNIAKKYPNVATTYFLSNSPASEAKTAGSNTRTGRMSLSALDARKDLYIDTPETKYFICGPSGFMKDMEAALLELGVAQGNIKMELFGTGGIPAGAAGAAAARAAAKKKQAATGGGAAGGVCPLHVAGFAAVGAGVGLGLYGKGNGVVEGRWWQAVGFGAAAVGVLAVVWGTLRRC
ncbi:hypothetical protein AJ80_06653 [Polytolypa hystricis UAMH7299]|uniref:nitric oxide dioxygenase n=1 Tax=Polytolypa hystricis (strain UAMH7299) TaxID=1447883 RepID=A0A2B7XUH7_POLH7|nr:hypothetical protein AJ80_06653 [Polytolypa hystricis UAMH7299]